MLRLLAISAPAAAKYKQDYESSNAAHHCHKRISSRLAFFRRFTNISRLRAMPRLARVSNTRLVRLFA